MPTQPDLPAASAGSAHHLATLPFLGPPPLVDAAKRRMRCDFEVNPAIPHDAVALCQ